MGQGGFVRWFVVVLICCCGLICGGDHGLLWFYGWVLLCGMICGGFMVANDGRWGGELGVSVAVVDCK